MSLEIKRADGLRKRGIGSDDFNGRRSNDEQTENGGEREKFN